MADHVNRKRYDNRFENLRIVTSKENTKNRTIGVKNTSGKQGITNLILKVRYESWQANIHDNEGNRLRKRYYIAQHGAEEAKRLAIEQRVAWENLYGYTGE